MKGDEAIQFTTVFSAVLAVSGLLPQQGNVSSDIFHHLSGLEPADFETFYQLDGVVKVIREKVVNTENEQFRVDNSRRLISCSSIREMLM